LSGESLEESIEVIIVGRAISDDMLGLVIPIVGLPVLEGQPELILLEIVDDVERHPRLGYHPAYSSDRRELRALEEPVVAEGVLRRQSPFRVDDDEVGDEILGPVRYVSPGILLHGELALLD